ncbi:MAG TPA: hypothetical protein VLG67_04190 [Candidatus Saccharimonadales bacterium]|nr:hypothetical protein [Candidatus Saccharimonadales bacterium]
MGNVETKIRYQPPEIRRFEVSQDPFSRERLRALLTTNRTLKQEIPFYAGMTLFGSLSKRKVLTAETAPSADIDVVTFMDTDIYDATISDFETDSRFQEYLKEHGRHVTPNKIGLRRAAGSFIQRRVSDLVSIETSNPVNVRTSIQEITDDTLFKSVEARKGNRIHTNHPGSFGAFNPASFFFLDIGNGLRKYREKFMEKLLTLSPVDAESSWQIVLKSMKKWERDGIIPDSISYAYPPTFKDAIEYYSNGNRRIVQAPESLEGAAA